MSGVGKFIGNVFHAVASVAKVVLPIALGIGAILFTGGAALGVTGLLAGGWGGAAAGITSALGLADTGVGAVLTGAITAAGTGAAIGGITAAVTGGNVLSGVETGALGGAVTGGVLGALGGVGSAAGAASDTIQATGENAAFTGGANVATAGAASSGAADSVAASPINPAFNGMSAAPANTATTASSGAAGVIPGPQDAPQVSIPGSVQAAQNIAPATINGPNDPSVFRGLTNSLGLTNTQNADGTYSADTPGLLSADGKTVVGDVISGVGKALLTPAPDAAEKDYQKFVTANYAQGGAPAPFQGLGSDASGAVAQAGNGLPQPAQAFNKQVPYEYFYNTQTKQIEKRPVVSAPSPVPPATS